MSEDSYSTPPKFMSEDGKWHFVTAISLDPSLNPLQDIPKYIQKSKNLPRQ